MKTPQYVPGVLTSDTLDMHCWHGECELRHISCELFAPCSRDTNIFVAAWKPVWICSVNWGEFEEGHLYHFDNILRL